MSHGDRDSHRQVFQDILSAADQLQRSVGILLDLCGPKIRTGRFENGAIELSTGDVVTITTRPRIGTSGIIVSQYEGLCRDVREGDKILLADGLIELKVTTSAVEDTVFASCMAGAFR